MIAALLAAIQCLQVVEQARRAVAEHEVDRDRDPRAERAHEDEDGERDRLLHRC